MNRLDALTDEHFWQRRLEVAVACLLYDALHTKSLSLRSRRKHKAWDASPRLRSVKRRISDSGRQPITFHAAAHFMGSDPYFCGLILGFAPQALCLRLLCRLRT